ncbi:MAG: cobyrinate a,c-diamide synthase [Gammaproteobacteria bacterium]|nr:cobyrinate a,c-diamide synthase [Gammaproteobacteria bacterium]MBT3490468.1 cobyrinate a,c-diamide synthase [Gammaproteobacteria bacterium]MBT3717601.1 cobyrinate a,c-diamide synthase [Gammaproteobacteria bacterium]MBT3845794.1 cobyrinate a,c-diamide synthase [Gammaproteobacteria bacterium]MBT3893598.1 cobyrinate a,c-diamide synthase [Gammaproteobacteria bacterium]
MKQLYLSAAHKSSGKTTVTLGLCAAFVARGLSVSPFKKGPDYIDPMWLSMAAGSPCHTLDFYTMEEQEILDLYLQERKDSDLVLLEGNKGLYDGLSLNGSDSNGAMAKLLQLPVILVINTNGITRGIAPLLLGYQEFDPKIEFAGVILNQTGNSRHEQKLQQVVEHYTDFQLLGTIRRHKDLEIVERHLGLVPSNEADAARSKIDSIRSVVESQVDLQRILEVAKDEDDQADEMPEESLTIDLTSAATLRIGIARDEAFGFYYPADLDAFRAEGVELVPFSPIHDVELPQVDGLLFGGGFPETHMELLESNHSMRLQIRDAIEAGLPAYAECGGLMYLSRQIEWLGRRAEMVGVVAGDCRMHERPQGRGYARFSRDGIHEIPAHEFHYSSLEGLSEHTEYAHTIHRGYGIDGKRDGVVYKNLLAGYVHQRNTRQNPWVKDFVHFVHKLKPEKSKDKQ